MKSRAHRLTPPIQSFFVTAITASTGKKICTGKNGCGLPKEYPEFYPRPGTDSRLSGTCKACTRAYQSNWRKCNLDKCRASNRRYRANHQVKVSAHRAVENAVRQGILIPQPCIECGEVNDVAAHHNDYQRQLDVVWFCQTHHREWHIINGEAKNA